MLEWGDVPGDSNKRQIYYNGVAQPGTAFSVHNVRSVNQHISDSPNYAERIAQEVLNCVADRGIFPPYTLIEVADFLIDKCEDEV